MRSQVTTSLIVLTLILSGQVLGGEGGSPEAPKLRLDSGSDHRASERRPRWVDVPTGWVK
jgi:hypothetical protein